MATIGSACGTSKGGRGGGFSSLAGKDTGCAAPASPSCVEKALRGGGRSAARALRSCPIVGGGEGGGGSAAARPFPVAAGLHAPHRAVAAAQRSMPASGTHKCDLTISATHKSPISLCTPSLSISYRHVQHVHIYVCIYMYMYVYI